MSVYLWHLLKLIACKIKGVEVYESGEVGEGGELVGVEEEAPEMHTAKERGKRGKGVSRKVEVLQIF